MRLLPLLALLLLPLPAPAQEAAPDAGSGGGFFSRLFGGDDEAPPALLEETAAEDDEGFITRFIEDKLSATARAVDIRGFAGALSSRATIDTLTIADGEGVWLRATDLALQWNRSALLGGRVEVDELTAGTVEVLRAPVPDAAAPRPEATRFRLPELPVSIQIGDLHADRIVLAEELLGDELVLALDGSVNLEGGEGTASLSAEIVEGSQGRLDFSGGYSNATRVLSLALDLEEAEGGLAARALRIPGLPALALRVEGTAPIDDYEATLALATDGEERIAGTFALQTTADPEEGVVTERAFGLDVRGDVTRVLAPSLAQVLGADVVLRTKGIRRSDGSLVLTSLGIEGDAIALRGSGEITPEGWPARLALRGGIGAGDGTPVPLPFFPSATVREVALDVAYDRAEGESWTGTFEVAGLAREGLAIEALSLAGGGTIRPATAAQAGRFTAALDYAARGLAFADASLGEALGADLTGRIDLVRDEDGGPLAIRELTLSGPGIEGRAEGTVAGPDDGFLIQSSLLLEAASLDRFADLTGLDLGGAADVTVVSSLRPLDGIFDLVMSGTTRDLALGIAPLDPLLAGEGTLALSAARDEDGLRLRTLDLATPALEATGEADITSGAGRAVFDLAVADLGLSFPGLSGPGTVKGRYDRGDDGAGTLVAEAALPGASASLDAAIGPDARDARGRPVPGLVTFEATARADELADLADLVASVAPDLARTPTGGIDLALAGTAEIDLDLFDVTVDARTRDLALGEPRLDAALAGEGRLTGRLIRTGFDALSVEDLRVSTDLVEGKLSADLAEGSGTADLDLRLADVAPILGGLSGPGRVTGTAARAEDGTTALDLDLALPTGTAQVAGTLSDAAEGPVAFAGDLAADFTDVAPLGALAGRPLSGAVEGTATGTVRLDLATLDLAFDARTRDLAVGVPPLDALLAGEGTLAGRAVRSGPLSFRVEDLRVDTDLVDGTVTAAFEDGEGSAEIDVALADVAPVLGGLSGPGRLTGTARGGADGQVALDLDATLPSGTARVDGTLDLADGYAFTGDVAADLDDIAPLGALAGRDLGGAVRGTASGTVRPDLSRFDLAFDLATRDLRVGQPILDRLLRGPGTLAGTAARSEGGDLALDVAVDTPQIRGDVQGSLGDGTGAGRFDLALADLALLAPGLSGPATATGEARGLPGGAIAIDAQATGPGLRAIVDATVAPPAQGSEIAGTADLALADLSLLAPLLGQPLTGGFDGTVTGRLLPSLAAFDLAVDGTATNLDIGNEPLRRLLAGSGAVAARVAKAEGGPLRIESLRADFPNIDLAASGGTDAVTFEATLADAALYASAFPGAVTARGTAAFGPGGVTLDAAVDGPGGLTTRATGPVGAATNLALVGDGPLALFNRILDPRRLDGPATFDLRLTGPGLQFLEGTVTTSGARLTDPILGEAIRGIQGSARLGGGVAELALTGQLATGGTLAVTGPLGILYPFDSSITITGTGLVVRDPALYEAYGDALLTVTGPLAGRARIAGRAALSRVEGRVPASDVSALGELPRVYHIEPSLPVVQTLRRAALSPTGEAISPETGAARGAGTPYDLDILLDAPARVFVRGRGLDVELGGQLRLTGTTTDVIPIGQFSLIRGRLDLLGQRFELTEGSGTLQGDFNPYIRVVAQTEARTGTEVRVVVEGPLESPAVTFESTPELPQDEVLAQLLFGVDIESITPLQAVRLASAVATLAGDGTGLLDDLRGGIGLSDFDVTTTEDGNIALRLGQYITDNVYTDVVVSPDETELTINLDLTPDLTVRAGATSAGETTLGLFYEKDY